MVICMENISEKLQFFWGKKRKENKAEGLKEKFKWNLNGKIMWFFTLIMFLSMVVGSIYTKNINLNLVKKLDILFLSDFDKRTAQGAIFTFASSFSSNFLFWISMVLSAMSFFGSVFVFLILVFRSLGLGFTAGYLYLIYSFKGIAFYILVLLPGIFISSICYIYMAANSVQFAIKVAKIFLPKAEGKPLWNSMVTYMKKCIYLLFPLVASSIVDAFLMRIFSKLFVF